MSRRRILHLIDTGGPGGAETIFLNLVTGLDPERWDSIAVIPERDWLYDALREHGVEPLVIPTQGSFDARYALKLTRLLVQQQVSVVQAHLLTSAVYGSFAARLARVPVVCTFHGTADLPDHERFRNLKVRAFDRPANRVVFVSDSLRQAFQRVIRLERAGVDVVWNGIDPLRFRPGVNADARAELGFGPNETLVGAIGNVRPSKAYDVLLRAAAILKTSSRAYRFVIVGDTRTPLYDELLALRHQLDLDDSVVFAGFRPDVARVLDALDVFVLSSRAEGFSLATVQALAAGVPVVATRCGGPEDILEHNLTGLLAENDDPQAVASAIERIAGDGTLAARLREAGRRIATERFSKTAMVARYEAIYDECTRRRVTARRIAAAPASEPGALV